MRAVVAKFLRRVAQEATVGEPARRLLVHKKTGVVMNDPQSTRAAYRVLKADHKQLKRAHRAASAKPRAPTRSTG